MNRIRLPHVIFETTPECNLSCRYCYNHWRRPGTGQPEVTLYHSALRTMKKLFQMADVEHVTFSGGEPFLSERFLELVLTRPAPHLPT